MSAAGQWLYFQHCVTWIVWMAGRVAVWPDLCQQNVRVCALAQLGLWTFSLRVCLTSQGGCRANVAAVSDRKCVWAMLGPAKFASPVHFFGGLSRASMAPAAERRGWVLMEYLVQCKADEGVRRRLKGAFFFQI